MYERTDAFLLQIQRKAMACLWEVLLNPDQYSFGPETAVDALSLVGRLEEKWSVFQPHSELSRFNAAEVSQWVELSSETMELVIRGLVAYQQTAGAFDMTAASLTEAWGFSRSKGRMPSAAELEAALKQVGSCYVEVDQAARRLRKRKDGLKVNPGGIGKGLALDRVAAWLRSSQVENFLIHGGKSSIVAAGNRARSPGEGWQIAVRNPRNNEQVLGILHLFDQSLGTTGHAHQFFHYQGQRFGHVIDPRSGWPIQGIESITVLCTEAAMADALATGLYVLGPNHWDAFARNHPEIAFLAVIPGKRAGSVGVETWNLGDRHWRTV